jgi:hypothetical protein
VPRIGDSIYAILKAFDAIGAAASSAPLVCPRPRDGALRTWRQLATTDAGRSNSTVSVGSALLRRGNETP